MIFELVYNVGMINTYGVLFFLGISTLEEEIIL